MSDACLFCTIVQGTEPSIKVFETDDVLVFKDKHPQASYHVQVIPKKHYKNLIDIPNPLLLSIFEVARELIKKEQLSGFRLVHNGNASALIDHFHLHIVGKVDKFKNVA